YFRMLTIVHIKKELSILYLGQKEKKNCHGRNGGAILLRIWHAIQNHKKSGPQCFASSWHR
ncbi:MAG: hypothetical protein ACYTEU_05300, partial [Planctomycetota bacterium]